MNRLASSAVIACACLLALMAWPAAAQRKRPAPPAPVEAPAQPEGIRVRAAMSQPAVWPGDAVDYVLDITMAPGVDVVMDDLAPEKLVVEGLELGDVSSSESTTADGTRTLQHRYRLVAWEAGAARVGALTIRFRRPVATATASGAADAVDVNVPAVTLAVRSTLPDDGSASGVRDRAAWTTRPAWVDGLRPTGIGFIVLGIAPVVLWLASRIRRPRLTRTRPSSRSLNTRAKSLLQELAIIDTSNADGRRRACDLIDNDVRAYLSQAEDVPAHALTAAELRVALANRTRVKGDDLCDVLAACEEVRYAPATRPPDAARVDDTIARLRSALER